MLLRQINIFMDEAQIEKVFTEANVRKSEVGPGFKYIYLYNFLFIFIRMKIEYSIVYYGAG